MPKVSIIVPAHNSERFLRPCLSSLVNQTLEDLEVLVVNDHSQDATKEIASRYEKDYPKKVKVFDLPTGTGAGTARNYGLKQAQGHAIGFVDSDDVISIDMYEHLLKQMHQFQISVAETGLIRISENDYTTRDFLYRAASPNQRPQIIDFQINPGILHHASMACGNKVYDHALLNNLKFPENCTQEDVAFGKLALLKSGRTIDTKRADYLYRKNQGSTMFSLLNPTIKILDVLPVCLDAIKQAKDNQFSSSQIAILKDELKIHLIHNLILISQWNITDEDREYLLTRLYAIYNFYFPNLDTIQDEPAYYAYLYLFLMDFQKYQMLKEPYDIEQEKRNVYQHILQLERKVLCQK